MSGTFMLKLLHINLLKSLKEREEQEYSYRQLVF